MWLDSVSRPYPPLGCGWALGCVWARWPSVCLGLPVLFVHVVGPFITLGIVPAQPRGFSTLPGMYSRGYDGYECNSDTAIEMRYQHPIFARHSPGSPPFDLQSFPPTL